MRSARASRQPVPVAGVELGESVRLSIGAVGDKCLSRLERGSFEHQDSEGEFFTGKGRQGVVFSGRTVRRAT